MFSAVESALSGTGPEPFDEAVQDEKPITEAGNPREETQPRAAAGNEPLGK